MSALAVVRSTDAPPETSAVTRMLAAAPHRGDDWVVRSLGTVCIGVSRTIDIPDADLVVDGSFAVALCGALDNRVALRRDVERRGATTAGDSDAAVLAAAFRLRGEALLPELRGVFAAAITDGDRLWCLRDHLGFRSLFYRDEPHRLLVASEAKQVCAGAGTPVRADRDVVEAIFFGDYGDETDSAVQGVRRLEKATVLRGDNGPTRRWRYWDPADHLETARYADAELRERFDALMTQAVARCLVGDGRDVVALSGGIDSPTMTAYAAPVHRERTGRALPALSIVCPEHPSVDESDFIRLMVDTYGLPWHTFEQRVSAGGDLDRWAELCDGPPATVTLSEMEESYRTAHRLGYRTMLTGELAEFVVDRPDGVLVHLLAGGHLRRLGAHVRAQHARGRRWGPIARELASLPVPRAAVVARQPRPDRLGWGRPAWIEEQRVAAGWARRASAPRRRWRERQVSAFTGPGLSMEANEVVEQVAGVRVRRPWVDIDLWQLFLSLPAETKYPEPVRKSIVRRLARGRVPDAILDRRKKTVFDDSVRARLDYDELKRWLLQPALHLPGVDYAAMVTRIENRELDLVEYRWARDLAAAHAFLERSG